MNKISLSIPPVFISRGSPDLPLRHSPARTFLKQLGEQMGPHCAVVMMSAHWGSGSPLVSMAKQYDSTIDFYGFPAELGQLHYCTPGELQVAERVLSVLNAGSNALA